MGRRQKLQTLCETRRGSRSYSLFTFLSAFSVVCSSFVELEHGGDAQARSYLCPITKFACIVCLVAVQ
jgi:predicted signal transduction protein with EAL and GGDEF domain